MGGDSATARRTRLAFIQEQTARRKTQAAGGPTTPQNGMPLSNGKHSQLAPRFHFPSMTVSSISPYDAFGSSFGDSPSPSPPTVTPKPRPISISSISSISSSSSSNSSSSPSSPSSSATSVTCTPASIGPTHSRSISLSSATAFSTSSLSRSSSPLSRSLLPSSRSSSASSLSSQPLSNGAAATGAPILNINPSKSINPTPSPDLSEETNTDSHSTPNASISSFDRQQYLQFMNETANQAPGHTDNTSAKFTAFPPRHQPRTLSYHLLPQVSGPPVISGQNDFNSDTKSARNSLGETNGSVTKPDAGAPASPTRTRRITIPAAGNPQQAYPQAHLAARSPYSGAALTNTGERKRYTSNVTESRAQDEEPFLFYSSDGRAPKGLEHLGAQKPPRQEHVRGHRGVRQIQEGFRFPPAPPTSHGPGHVGETARQQQHENPKSDFELIYEAVPKSHGSAFPQQQPSQARHDHYAHFQHLQRQRQQRPPVAPRHAQASYSPASAATPSFLPFPTYQTPTTFPQQQSSLPWPSQSTYREPQRQNTWPLQPIPQQPNGVVAHNSPSPAPSPKNEQSVKDGGYMLQKGFKYPPQLGPGLAAAPQPLRPDTTGPKTENTRRVTAADTFSAVNTSNVNPSPLIQRLQQRTARVMQEQANGQIQGRNQTSTSSSRAGEPNGAHPGPVGMRKYTHARSISSPSLLGSLGMNRINIGGGSNSSSNGPLVGNGLSGLGKTSGGMGNGGGGVIGSGVGVGGSMNVVGSGTGTVRKKTHRKSASSLDSILEEEWE